MGTQGSSHQVRCPLGGKPRRQLLDVHCYRLETRLALANDAVGVDSCRPFAQRSNICR